MKPYGLISDTHNHGWSAFSTTGADGVNSRLQEILSETKRCAQEVRAAGGDTIVHAGDLFHVRGKVAPSVLNPTMDSYRELIDDGFQIIILAGNHDLEGKTADRLGSAVTAMQSVGCKVVNSLSEGLAAHDDVVLVPWIQDLQELKETLDSIAPARRSGSDLVIHAPVDGVIAGLPDHGLTAAHLAGLGFQRVFAGHYHNHKQLNDSVYSIGALTHQTWGDVGSKAGFLIVSGTEVKHFASHAPSFIDVDGSTDPTELPLVADGNYVRCRIKSAKPSEIEALREHLVDCGARGVVIISQPDTKAVPTRSGVVTTGTSLDVSVQDYVVSCSFARQGDVAKICAEVLAKARAEMESVHE